MLENIIIELAKDIVTSHKALAYIFFFISQSLQILFPPYPGDMVLILEGYLSSLANLNIMLVICNAVFATFLSSILLYHLGKLEKERILTLKIVKILFDVKKVNSLRKLFNKFGSVAIIISKFIPGIFSITVLCAGIFEVRKRSAYLGILIITSFHHILLIMLGRFLGENWTVVFKNLNAYNKYVLTVIIIGILLYGIVHLLKNRMLDS